MGRLTSRIVPGDWNSVAHAIARLDARLNTDSSPTFLGVGLTGLTENALMYVDGDGVLTSLSAASNGQLIIGSTGAAPSVAALTGTASQIVVTPGAGSITLSTPQDIHTGASPTFAGLVIGSLGGILKASSGTVSGSAAHSDLSDMADSAGTVTDHDTRLVAKVQTSTPTTPTPFIGMLWYDTDASGTVAVTDHSVLSNLDYASAGHTGFQPADAGLTSLAGLTYVSDSFIKVTATDTYAIRTIAETKSDLSLNLVENTALSTWIGTSNITILGTVGTGTWQGTTIAINQGGTGQITAQAAIDSLSAVSGATNEHVLTKDTATGNAIWKAAAGGGGAFGVPAGRLSLGIKQNNLPTGVWTKVELDVIGTGFTDGIEDTDNHRITPGVEGLYLIIFQLHSTPAAPVDTSVAVYKNGAFEILRRDTVSYSSSTHIDGSDVVYLDDDDYIELYAKLSVVGDSGDIINGNHQTYLVVQRIQ